jgi:hypothetical protein
VIPAQTDLSVFGGTINRVDEPPDDAQETATSWTNPWIAEYKRRQAMLMEMRAYEVIAMMRDLNLTSYAFSKNAEELQTHILRYPEIGQSQPFNPDVGDPFGSELARLFANFLGSVKSLISGQRTVLRDICSCPQQLSRWGTCRSSIDHRCPAGPGCVPNGAKGRTP